MTKHVRNCLWLALMIGVTASGCGAEPQPVDAGEPPPPTADAGTPDAGDAGLSCEELGTCASSLTWSPASDFPTLREHHASFLAQVDAGSFLYVLSGADLINFHAYTIPLRAALNPDGGVGEWESLSSKVPKALFGPAVAVVGRYVLLSGGTDLVSHTESTASYVAEVRPTGALGPWTTGPAFGQGVMHHCTVADGEHVYSIGGLYWSGQVGMNVSTVLRTRLSGSTFESWTEDTPLPDVRSHHACAIDHGTIYVTGGIQGNPRGSRIEYQDVLASRIGPDHTLGPWEKVVDLPKPISIHASFARGEHLYLLGGLSGGTWLSDVWRIRTSASSAAWGYWEPMGALPIARGHVHQTPLWRNHVYSVGGANEAGSLANVFVGRFQ